MRRSESRTTRAWESVTRGSRRSRQRRWLGKGGDKGGERGGSGSDRGIRENRGGRVTPAPKGNGVGVGVGGGGLASVRRKTTPDFLSRAMEEESVRRR